MSHQLALWIEFHVVVIAALAADLGVFERQPRKLSRTQAGLRTLGWIALALLFNVGIWFWHDRDGQAALEWLTAYLVEEALSVDNLFVFLVIFNYFSVPDSLQPRVLRWGILGAVLMRASLIALGTAALRELHWILYVFGAFLILTGLKLLTQEEQGTDPGRNPVLRLARRYFRVTPDYGRGWFWARLDGTLWATPLLLVLLTVETTDLVFAIDSIPAVLAISRDPFIAYTSNIFAVLGLRALYFLLAGMLDAFRYLKYGLSVVLVFIGIKMLVSEWLEIPIAISLGVVAGILGLSVLVSLVAPHARATAAADDRPSH
jgi:tellurite resistance protein TerC